MVFVNHYNRLALGAPFGGSKHSGYGREHCMRTLYEYGYSKTLRLPLGDGEIDRWDAVAQVFA
ncbi:aldehyde dehydrogenase family protein [Nocardia terpenica]|uniref:aldehyde dehydrogenase family protein n=1 Tax=Nocardia terpenica TaxID=455432 RepID=UPI002FE06F5C